MGGEAAITGVATAVPLFVGYTECAGDPVTGARLYNQPVAIGSMADFTSHFGGPPPIHYEVQPADAAPDFTALVGDGAGGLTTGSFKVVPRASIAAFNLFWQMRLFFANGGAACIVVSAGSYWAGQSPATPPGAVSATWTPRAIAVADLRAALAAGGQYLGVTMTVVPEACLLGQAEYAAVAQAMLAQAAMLGDRMAILDLPACQGADSFARLQLCQANFWDALAPQAAAASYGAVYAPALATTAVARGDILCPSLAGASPAGNAAIHAILTTQASQLYSGAQLATLENAIAQAFPCEATEAPGDPADDAAITSLLGALPLYATITDLVAARIGVQPPSGMLAGIWSQSDAQNGVWSAPANIALTEVSGPLVALSDSQQAGFNVPANGLAINILRMQPNRGTLVWGARTLDGNSNDYRYIHARRTLIYIERSIKVALETYAFSPNDAATWNAVTASVSAFLTGLWQAGGLVGSKASDAFTVACGMGTTMTAQDVLDGNMIVGLTLQMINPAEFIQLRIMQKMVR